MTKAEKLLNYVSELNPKALYPTDMKQAIIGYVERCGQEPLILLNRKKCIKILMEQNMNEEEAEEFFEYNTIGAFMGEGTPCFATLTEDITL